MFGELPKLFGRDFAIGFLLPVAIFIPATALVVNGFWPGTVTWNPGASSQTNDSLLGATVFVFTAWLGGVLLLALNQSIIRLKEGYGRWNPLRLLEKHRRNRFRELQKEVSMLDRAQEEATDREEDLDRLSAERRVELKRFLVERFPHEERFVLPTSFGNTIRAFEAYPLVMYGLDAIPGWSRLILIMSDSSRAMVESAKAQMDFWVNIWALSILLTGEYILGVIITRQTGFTWTLLAIPLAWIASACARSAAESWGDLVKASFDVYIGKLRKELELAPNLDRMADQEQWEELSRAILYCNPEALPARAPKLKENSETEERSS